MLWFDEDNISGASEPSWRELTNFVGFLDKQLAACETCVFTNPDLMEGFMPDGFNSFVVSTY